MFGWNIAFPSFHFLSILLCLPLAASCFDFIPTVSSQWGSKPSVFNVVIETLGLDLWSVALVIPDLVHENPYAVVFDVGVLILTLQDLLDLLILSSLQS